jgi:hypothetical protein
MEEYYVYYSMRGTLRVQADSEKDAEEKGYELLRSYKVPSDDHEIHCAEEVGYGGYNG